MIPFSLRLRHSRAVIVLGSYVLAAPVTLTAQGDLSKAQTAFQKLPNGLSAYLYRPPTATGQAELRLIVRAGSAYETDAQRGAAFLASQLALQGTEHFPGDSLKAYLHTLASELTIDTTVPAALPSYGATVYRLSVLTDSASIARGLALLADWARGVAPTAEALTKGRPTALATLTKLVGHRPPGRDLIDSLTVAGTPYAEHPAYGTAASLGALTPEAVAQFVHTWYRPDNIGVVVATDLPIAQSRKLVTAAFAGLPAASGALAARPVLNTIYGPVDPATKAAPKITTAVVTDPDAATPWVTVVLQRPPAPPKGAGAPGTASGLRDSLLTELYAALLDKRLHEVALNVTTPLEKTRVTLQGAQITGFNVIAQAHVRSGTPESAVSAITTEVARIAQNGFNDDDLAGWKTALDSARARNPAAGEIEDPAMAGLQQYIADFTAGAPYFTLQERAEQSGELLDNLGAAALRQRGQLWGAAPRAVVVVGLAKGSDASTVAQAALADSAAAPFGRQLGQAGLSDSTLQIVTLTPVQGKHLIELLQAEVARAVKMKLTPIVELGATWCSPCRAIETGMFIPTLRNAFKYMYVIRLDQDVWGGSLPEAGMRPGGLPAFYALGRDSRANGLSQEGIEGDAAEVAKGASQKVADDAAPALAAFFAKCRAQFNGGAAAGSKPAQSGQ